MAEKKPSAEKIIEYAMERLKYQFATVTTWLAKEVQADIKQEIALWILENYADIKDEDWMAYVGKRCAGEIIDFTTKSTTKNYTKFTGKGSRKAKRKCNRGSDGDVCGIEQTLNDQSAGKSRIKTNKGSWTPDSFETTTTQPATTLYEQSQNEVQWNLLKRMAYRDVELKAFLQQILDIKLKDISLSAGVNVSRADQRVAKFISRFTSKPVMITPDFDLAKFQMCFFDLDEEVLEADPCGDQQWNYQVAWALRISEYLGWPDCPQYYPGASMMIGASLPMVDLEEITVHQSHKHKEAVQSFDENELGRMEKPKLPSIDT